VFPFARVEFDSLPVGVIERERMRDMSIALLENNREKGVWTEVSI
jgi:hypothetical protein